MKDKINQEAISLIHNRCSVRNFTGESVSKDDLLTIVRAGMSAPSAVDYRPWEFIVVTEREILDKLADGLPYAKMLYKAGAAIIVCAVPRKAYNQSKEYAIIDSTLCSENILLTVEALGLGALWTATYPDKTKMNYVAKLLNIPKDIIPLNVIPIGHPTGEDKPKDKYNKQNIHWEKW